MKLTEKLDMLMQEKRINRVELSKGTEIPYSTIASLYDKGYENVKLSTLKKLADYFNCSLDYIADDNITDRNQIKPNTIAAHLPEGEVLTEEEQESLDEYIKFLLSRREK